MLLYPRFHIHFHRHRYRHRCRRSLFPFFLFYSLSLSRAAECNVTRSFLFLERVKRAQRIRLEWSFGWKERED